MSHLDLSSHWNYETAYASELNLTELAARRSLRMAGWESGDLYKRYLDSGWQTRHPKRADTRTFTVQTGRVAFKDVASDAEETAKLFCPWKKGPFQLGPTHIDSEWRSNLKWQRIADIARLDIQGKRIADIGCANGYFLYRMFENTKTKPELAVGFEPVAKNMLCFDYLSRLAVDPAMQFEPLGIQDLDLFPKFFDVILCLGILYHHTDPVSLLRTCRSSLRPGGKIIVEVQGLPGGGDSCLVPKAKYAGAKGVWWVPQAGAAENWLRRSGFQNPVCFFDEPLSPEEQRSTPWAELDSLKAFLDPENPRLTREGYPAPNRIYLQANL